MKPVTWSRGRRARGPIRFGLLQIDCRIAKALEFTFDGADQDQLNGCIHAGCTEAAAEHQQDGQVMAQSEMVAGFLREAGIGVRAGEAFEQQGAQWIAGFDDAVCGNQRSSPNQHRRVDPTRQEPVGDAWESILFE